ncbi:MAG TPA: glycosyl hydrolase, partial [Acidobacteriaceae bacterium]
DLISANHYDLFAARAREHGLGVQAESGGPHGAPIDALETFRHSAIPQTEFWSQNPHRNGDRERFFTKEAASAADIYGQRFVAQEGETSIGPQWSESLASDLKPSFDMAITEGMNRLVWHEFTSSPANTGVPGQEYFAGTHLNPKVTWWNSGIPFFDYLNRIQFLMQQGTPVNDVLYYYGDNIPNFVRYKADDPAHVLPGYDYDVTNQDALLHSIRIEGRDLVSPANIHWHALALPHTRRVSLAVVELADRYLHSGGAVISLPPLSPTGITKPEDLRRFNALVAEIWQSCAAGSSHIVGSGHLFCTDDTHAALAQLHIRPDVELPSAQLKASSTTGIDYIHRRTGNTDIYFLRNPTGRTASFPAIFRAAGHAELWDAVTGNIFATPSTPISSTSPEGQRSRIDLTLPAYGSLVVIFTPEQTPAAPPRSMESRTEAIELASPWSLTIDSGPAQSSDLTSWTNQDSTKYFSGTAVYRATFIAPQLASGETACLRFESVREIATVKLNGEKQPSIWAPPYMACFDGTLHPGQYNLEIAVTNLWHNRLVGDAQPGAQVTVQTNIALPDPKSDLLPSGLIGPAEWVISK